tara:strand:- start:5121 stop:5855 length:735 start_codon:yes stop_codon:yes gene_type:complete
MLQCTIFPILPFDLEILIFYKLHKSLLSKSINTISQIKTTNHETELHPYLPKWSSLLNDIIYIEEKLYELIKNNRFISLIVNTNLPKQIYIKCLGEKFESIVRKSIVTNKRLPKSLRNYILYKDNYVWHIRFNITAAEVNNFDYNINYPGGSHAWGYYFNGTENQCKLSDLSKVQWGYMEFDSIINDLRMIPVTKDKFNFIREVNSTSSTYYDGSSSYDNCLKKYIFISNFDIQKFYYNIKNFN